MTKGSGVDKDRLFFTQCNETILFKCPECTSTKILRQCKIFRNFPALWRHLKQDHNDILESRMDEIVHVLDYTFKAFQWNMFPKWEYSEIPKTTTSSLLIDGRKPRIDRHEKLEKIAKLLKIQSQFYPKFKPRVLKQMIRIAIGGHDYRTMEFYFSSVTYFSKKDKIQGMYDVTEFCEILGA